MKVAIILLPLVVCLAMAAPTVDPPPEQVGMTADKTGRAEGDERNKTMATNTPTIEKTMDRSRENGTSTQEEKEWRIPYQLLFRQMIAGEGQALRSEMPIDDRILNDIDDQARHQRLSMHIGALSARQNWIEANSTCTEQQWLVAAIRHKQALECPTPEGNKEAQSSTTAYALAGEFTCPSSRNITLTAIVTVEEVDHYNETRKEGSCSLRLSVSEAKIALDGLDLDASRLKASVSEARLYSKKQYEEASRGLQTDSDYVIVRPGEPADHTIFSLFHSLVDLEGLKKITSTCEDVPRKEMASFLCDAREKGEGAHIYKKATPSRSFDLEPVLKAALGVDNLCPGDVETGPALIHRQEHSLMMSGDFLSVLGVQRALTVQVTEKILGNPPRRAYARSDLHLRRVSVRRPRPHPLSPETLSAVRTRRLAECDLVHNKEWREHHAQPWWTFSWVAFWRDSSLWVDCEALLKAEDAAAAQSE